ncbi:MAG: hypothetical protein AAFV98_07220 [Chloroflexota bacterium]
MRTLSRLALLLLCCTVVAYPVIAQDDSDDETDESERIVLDAMVSDVSLDDETNTLTLTVDIPDTCTEVGDILQSVEDDVITITVQVTTPPDVMCGAQFSTEDVAYEIVTDDLTAGEYTLVVNEIEQETTITVSGTADSEEDVVLECPTADDETLLYDEDGVCFLYPADYESLSAGSFVLVSKPLTMDALLIITVEDAEDTTLESLMEDIDEDAQVMSEVVIGGQDALVVESESSRVAHIIVDESYYTFTVEPIGDDVDDSGELLWETVIDSLFFSATVDDDS